MLKFNSMYTHWNIYSQYWDPKIHNHNLILILLESKFTILGSKDTSETKFIVWFKHQYSHFRNPFFHFGNTNIHTFEV